VRVLSWQEIPIRNESGERVMKFCDPFHLSYTCVEEWALHSGLAMSGMAGGSVSAVEWREFN